MTDPTLYRIVDEYHWLEREDEYTGLTITEAAIRMDDLTGCGEDVILSDWDEKCDGCKGNGLRDAGNFTAIRCPDCGGDGEWPGPWEWSDDDTNRTVTMMREVG